jgi:hypothetical protein
MNRARQWMNSTSNTKHTLLTLATARSLTGAALADHAPGHIKSLVLENKEGAAILGYDSVAYFTVGKPAKGDPTIEATFNGALYHFVSQANRERFEKDPTQYAPAYGGYCGYAASIGRVRPANPLLWSVADRQLIVQPTEDFQDIINKGRFTMTALADFTLLQDGVPSVHDGHVVGAIGVSGAKSAQQDEDIAKAGAIAITETKTAAR